MPPTNRKTTERQGPRDPLATGTRGQEQATFNLITARKRQDRRRAFGQFNRGERVLNVQMEQARRLNRQRGRSR